MSMRWMSTKSMSIISMAMNIIMSMRKKNMGSMDIMGITTIIMTMSTVTWRSTE